MVKNIVTYCIIECLKNLMGCILLVGFLYMGLILLSDNNYFVSKEIVKTIENIDSMYSSEKTITKNFDPVSNTALETTIIVVYENRAIIHAEYYTNNSNSVSWEDE